MLGRYLKAQLWVLLCGGLVGPIFLIVYFALGPMARPALNWMFWSGLLVTAAGVLAALALASHGARTAERHQLLTEHGLLATARVTGISETPVFVNEQQLIKVDLRIEPPGQPGFTDQQTVPASPSRMQVLAGHQLAVLLEAGTRNYEIDWQASALLAGVVPAEFTVAEDGTTYDLTGRAGPLMEVLQVLHAHRIPLDASIDIRSNPVVRQEIIEIVRRAGAGSSAGPSTDSGVGRRLAELEALRSAGAVTEDEYTSKRAEILSDL